MIATSIKPTRKLTGEQLEIVRVFNEQHGIDPEDVWFYDDDPEPNFTQDALNTLANQAGCFEYIAVEPIDSPQSAAQRIVMCGCEVILKGGLIRRNFGACVAGELIQGRHADSITDMYALAGARALRKTLRAAGFDPMRAYRNPNQTDNAVVPEDEQRKADIGEIHKLARELGYITKEGDTMYRDMIAAMFPGLESSKQMDAKQRSVFIAVLRGRVMARQTRTNAA